MDCRTAHLLIEAFHDDELGVVEAASLLAHLEVCNPCARHHEASRRLKKVFLESRPVVICPEALRRRVSRRIDHGRRFPRAIPPSVTLFVVAAGLGFLVGEVVPAMPLRDRSGAAASIPLVERARVERVRGEVFCLRCALEKLFPGSTYQASPHRAILRTADGRLFTVLPGTAGARLLNAGCTGRRVDVVARLYPENGLAEVLTVAGGPPASASAQVPALTLARN